MSFQNCKIYKVGADDREYHGPNAERGSRDFVMSSSALRLVFAKCPRAWRRGYTLADTAAKDYGSLVDCLVLTPGQLNARYAVRPDTYLDDKGNEKPWHHASNTCKAWLAEHKGLEVISSAELSEAKKAVSRIFDEPQVKPYLDGCDMQVWIKGEWHDEPTGLVVPVQCLIDFVQRFVPLTKLSIGDLKTTKNAAVLPWANWARYVGYDLQAAWNLDLFNAATGEDRRVFEWILSESDAPYEVGRRYDAIDDLTNEQDEASTILSGRRRYRLMMGNYCQFLAHDRWPGYDDTDESSGGKTRFVTDPYEEQRRMFAPRFNFEPQIEPTPEEENIDTPP